MPTPIAQRSSIHRHQAWAWQVHVVDAGREPGPEASGAQTAVSRPGVTVDASGNPAPGPQDSRAEPREGDRMPRWVPRAIGMALVGLILLDVGATIIVRLSSLLVILLISLFASFAIEPAVNWIAERGVRRGTATGIVLTGSLLGLVLFFVAIGSVVAVQLADLADDAPAYARDVETWVNDQFNTELDMEQFVEELTDAEGPLRGLATSIAANALSFTVRAVAIIFQIFAVLLFTFYLVADGPRLRRSICSLLRPERQMIVLRTWEIAIQKTGSYIYSRALLAGLSAIATWIALSLIGVPYPVALALWFGVMSQFIPTVGTYLGALLPILIALVDRPSSAVWVLVFAVLYQQLENYVLAPRISARTMELHPAVAFGSVIAGASILGPVGALLALPAAAVFHALGSTYLARHEVVDSAMTRAPTMASRATRRQGVTDHDGSGA